jgi:phospholipid/cholesterol/gamma-HCH transport system permease protein
MIGNLGKWVLRLVESQAELFRIIARACGNFPLPLKPWRRPIVQVFLKQLYFTGLESLKIVIVISLTIGAVLMTQIITLVGAGNEALIGRVLVWSVVRELGPLLTAIVVVARSGAAIATELGSMKIAGEIDSIESLGIPSEQYLIVPRIFGVTTAVMILTIYFEIFSIMGGFIVASTGWHVSIESFSQGIFFSLTITELFMSFLKSLFFGLFLAAACCRNGLDVGKSATQVPQAATKGVMQSLFLIFIIDGLITFASLAFRNS